MTGDKSVVWEYVNPVREDKVYALSNSATAETAIPYTRRCATAGTGPGSRAGT